ncbi:MAG: hypothetical protein HDT24_04525 [Ruminococcus sp.]|nr:hypothetical protein [Ruminococcus sp.]
MAEIVLVGTFHYPERFDIFSQGVQNQIDEFTNRLALFHPNKIAVEFPYGMQNKLDELYARSEKHCFGENAAYGNIERYGSIVPFKSVNEIVQIGFRLGNKLNHDKIYGIDEDIELSDELFEKITPYMDMNSYFEKIQMMTEKTQDLKELYAIHNSDAYITFDHSMYMAMNKINLGNYEGSQLVLQWYERNLKIFSNLQNVCEKEDKVLVLIGSSYLKILKELIRASSEMDLCEEI